MSSQNGSRGYVYIVNWERFQHYKTRRPAWLKLYVDLLGNDEWLELRPSDVKLLCALWMLAGVHGNGRVRADEKWLKEQAKSPRGSLKALSDAGFIEVRASKALAQRYQAASDPASATASPDTEKERDTPLTPHGGNGLRPRAQRAAAETQQKRAGAVRACRREYQQAIADGELHDAILESLERDYRHDLTIVTEALNTLPLTPTERLAPGDVPI